MKLNEYQALARRTQNHELLMCEKESHALHGLSGEVGEIHSIYQKIYQGHNKDYNKIIDEMGDLLWFVAELADALCVSLDHVAEHNIEKLRKRYPEGFSEDRSVHREEYA